MLVGSFFAIASALALSLLISTGADTVFILVAYPAFNFLRGIAQPASSAVVAHHEIKNLSTGLSLLSIAGNLGFAIGPILGGYLAQTIDYSSVFLFSAAVPVVTSAIAALAIRGGLLSGKKMSDAVSRPRLRWGADRNLMIFLALTLCGYLVLGYEIAPISVYVRNFLGFSPEEIGYLFATNGIVIVILQLPMSKFFFKMRRLVYPIIAGCGLATLSFLVAGVSSTFLEFDLMMVILTLGEILITVPSQTVVTLFSTAESRGTFQGYYSAASIGGRSLAALVGLYSFQVLARTPSLGWYAIGILSAVLALGFYAVSGPLQRDYATQGTQEVRPGAFS
jgi:MFS family permease